MMGNKEVYSTTEFDVWANVEGLSDIEKFLIERYLNKNGITLEAGTAGGRILLEMKDLGFSSLYGFDYIPEFIERAKQKDISQSIVFEIQDATELKYQDSRFDQVLYLQQIINSIEEETDRLKSIKEAYRVLKVGGTAIFSFLLFEIRNQNALYVLYLKYLSLIRKLRGSSRSIQYIPWLKQGGKFNFYSLIDTGSCVYWYKIQEVEQLLKEVGFEIVAMGSSYQINQEKMHTSVETLVKEPIKDMLAVVCKK